MDQSQKVPMLLGNSSYYGTLAAIRSIGRLGVPVVALDQSGISPGKYSRYTTKHLRSPPFERTKEWVAWLRAAGKSFAGAVIYATSDAISYALARHRGELASLFQLLQPDLDTMMCLLDKGQLLRHAHAVGIDTPETWLPSSREQARDLVECFSQDVIVKPRCQLAVKNYSKGILCHRGATKLMADFDRMVAIGPHDPDFARDHPDVMQPMFQVYHAETRDRVYSLSGFCDRSGSRTATLAAVKIFQRPRSLGIGICFEEAPVDTALAAKVYSLCKRVGYYGAFECEFIQAGDRYLLIDFNARFYNQLGFDIARGLDLPKLVYAAAIGDESAVDELIALQSERQVRKPHAFCNSFQLAMLARVSRSLGTMSRYEARRWRQWLSAREKIMVDAIYDPDDRLPYAVDAANQFYFGVRHPRALLRDCQSK